MILCATDLSGSAQSATALAAWLSRRFDDPILLVHVVEPAPMVVPEVAAANATWLATALDLAKTELEAAARDLRATGLRVETQIAVGNPPTVILAEAQRTKARFITIGTHGRKGAARLFLGSVAERVTAGARCPVIVTRETSGDQELWPATRAFNLAVATDGSPAGGAALDWVNELGRLIPCEVTIVPDLLSPREAARYGLADPWVGSQGHPELVRLLERDLLHRLGSKAGSYRIRLVPTLANPVDIWPRP